MKDVYCYLRETKSFNKETSKGYFWDDVQIFKTPSDSKIHNHKNYYLRKLVSIELHYFNGI